MVEIEEDLQALLDEIVALGIRHIGNETDATGIMLARRVEQPLGGRAPIHPAERRRGFASAGPRERVRPLVCRTPLLVHNLALPSKA